MSLVSEETRNKELANEQKFNEGINKLESYTRQSEENLMSTRDRLLKRLKHSTHHVAFFDGEEEFTVEVRMLSPAEQNQIIQLQVGLAQYRQKMLRKDTKRSQKDIEAEIKKAKTMLDQLNQWVANICVDPELDYSFWGTGEGFNSDVPAHILAEAMRHSQDYNKDLKWFRKEPAR